MANFKFNWKKIQLRVTQAGAGDPALTTLNSSDPNSAGFGTLTPARTGAGIYTITSSGTPFTANKVKVSFTPVNQAPLFPVFSCTVTSTSVLTINTVDVATAVQALADSLLNGFLEIEVAA